MHPGWRMFVEPALMRGKRGKPSGRK